MSDTPRTDNLCKTYGDNEKCVQLLQLKLLAMNLERELNFVTADRDSETLWAAQYKKERDEARECLREAIQFRDKSLSKYYLERWRKAAELEEDQ